MTPELLLGVVPTVIAVTAVIASWFVSRRARSLAHWCASGLVLVVAGFSLLILHRMFVLGAWPTYLPHAMIAVSVGVAFAQWMMLKCKRA